MLKKLTAMGSAIALSLSVAANVQAAVSAQEAAKLGNSLTPFGANVSGNGKAVSTGLGIPDWTGGIQKKDIPKEYTRPGQHHPDPYKNDKVVFTITAQNLSKYADKVPDGVQGMLKTYPDTFKLNVYPSHRSTSAPQWVYDNTKSNATRATLAETGVDKAFGGIPFPILSGSNEDKAQQAIWNHILRWRGLYVVRRASEVAV